MPITNLIRDNWCRFQGELFPEIQDAVGPLLKKYQGFVMALRSTAECGTCAGRYCPAKYQVNPPFRGPLPNLPRAIFQGRYIRP